MNKRRRYKAKRRRREAAVRRHFLGLCTGLGRNAGRVLDEAVAAHLHLDALARGEV